MVVFHVDLDNTLIYSYRHEIGGEKICAEIYQGRPSSFLTVRTAKLLKQVAERALLVPTTTRTEEQYERVYLGIDKVHLGIDRFPYALVCNGGVLLKDGQQDELWYEESEKLAAVSADALLAAHRILETEPHRIMEIRNIRGLFLFTKCDPSRPVLQRLRAELDLSLVDVLNIGAKIYVIPVLLNKGMAIRRLKKRLFPRKVLAAGDSEFDLPMFDEADLSFAPAGLWERCGPLHPDRTIRVEENKAPFSERMLELALHSLTAPQ